VTKEKLEIDNQQRIRIEEKRVIQLGKQWNNTTNNASLRAFPGHESSGPAAKPAALYETNGATTSG